MNLFKFSSLRLCLLVLPWIYTLSCTPQIQPLPSLKPQESKLTPSHWQKQELNHGNWELWISGQDSIWKKAFPKDYNPTLQISQIQERLQTLKQQSHFWSKNTHPFAKAEIWLKSDSILIIHSPIQNHVDSTLQNLFQAQKYYDKKIVNPSLLLKNAYYIDSLQTFVWSIDSTRSELSKEQWIQNILIACEIDPTELDGNWQKTPEAQIYQFSGNQLQGQFIFKSHGIQFRWTKNSTLPQITPPPSVRSLDAQDEAQILNLQGLDYVQKGENLVALSYFEKAFALDSTNPLFLVNCAFVYQHENLSSTGIGLLSAHENLVQKSSRLSRAMGSLLESQGSFDEAYKYYLKAEKYLFLDEENTIDLSDALWGMGYKNPSLEIVQDLYEQIPSQRLGIYMAKTMIGIEQYEAAIRTLSEVKKKWGATADLRHHLALSLLLQEKFEDALAEARLLTKNAPDQSEYWLIKAQIEYRLKQFHNAHQSLLQVLKLDPDHNEALSLSSSVAAYLDLKESKLKSRPISPVFNFDPKEFRKTTHDSNLANLRIHKRLIALNYPKNQKWKKTEAILLEIKNEEGAAALNELSWNFLPGYDKIFVNKIQILDSQFQVIQDLSHKEFKVTRNKVSQDSSEARMVHAPLPPLQKGQFLAYQVSYEAEKAGLFPFQEIKFQTSINQSEVEVRVYADTSLYRFEQYGGIQMSIHPHYRSWTVQNPPIWLREKYALPYSEYGQGLLLGAHQSWSEVGRDYLNLIRRQFQSNLSIEEKAYEIQGAENNPFKIILRVNDWVKNQIQYEHIPFGDHSIIPAKPTLVLEKRRGDCKDKALLLKSLLAALNIPSHLALINLDDQIFESIVSPEQFDHMILYVPKGPNYPAMWLDPSEGLQSFRPISFELENKIALVLDEENKSHIELIPTLETQSQAGGEFFHQMKITEGRLLLKDSIRLSGKFADYFRNLSRGVFPYQAKSLIQEWYNKSMLNVEVLSARLENPQDYDKDFVIVSTYNINQNLDPQKGEFPLFFEKLFLELGDSKRSQPMQIPQEHRFTSHFELLNSAGYNLKKEDPPLLHYAEINATKENTKALSYQWHTKSLLVEADEYPQVFKEWQSIAEFLSVRWLRE